ncbi:DUF2563 family protein [Mycolicibacillus parakoreensis]|uniref:DUF2563 family protein n=1 Tax=Mycolicibacillus parakoreensis TaxID=1069221 RepID=A0ABY3TZ42_9MYCO|nr:DUF2563 family protein [Mycolicibacillus parakoreensis]MCV7314259.1 DUF2563 family protein [Mycolicibacillus parakoreensis]ULN52970.1 DUF2563 family protein [Mycolicibacillus parakoreensis]
MNVGDMTASAPLLVGGGAACGHAAGAAQMGADRLGALSAATTVFGDFAEARQFHGAVTAARDDHRTRLREHQRALTAYVARATETARVFTGTDRRNAAAITDTTAGLA